MISISTVTPVYSGEAYLEQLVAELDRVRSLLEQRKLHQRCEQQRVAQLRVLHGQQRDHVVALGRQLFGK